MATLAGIRNSMNPISLDHPNIARVLFHPQPLFGPVYSNSTVRLVDVEVEPGLSLGGRLYPTEEDSPALLYFHGNGEIAANYDDVAPLYRCLEITLLVMDYRCYGRSGGQASAANLLSDALAYARAAPALLHENGLVPPRVEPLVEYHCQCADVALYAW